MGKQKPTREGIIKAWKEADAKGDKPVGATEVATAMGISEHWIWKLFAGESLTDMKRENGIRLSPQEKHLSDDELFSALDEVVSDRQRIPGWFVLRHATGIPESTWKKRLGGRKGCSKEDVYTKYGEWLRVKEPKSTNLEKIRSFLQGRHPPEKTPTAEASPGSRGRQTPIYQQTDSRKYGKLLHFGNLTYEPTTELGVVFLFGMVSKALGFDSIEYLGQGFPDCEGKRRVNNRQQLENVRIEFEYRSSSYDHDPGGCDVIVCWEHNWKECPLEVIELKKEIKGLRERPEFKV